MAQEKDSIPYGTYGRLKVTVDQFAEATTPTSLNTHVLRGVSGGDFSALMTALKFLGLINDNQTVKPEFRELVEARKRSEDDYKAALLKIIETAYKPITGKIDIAHGTLPDVEKAFKDAGVPQGQMVTKAIRFYVKALEDCGVKVSDYITKPRPPKPRTPKAPKKAKDKTPRGGGAAGDGTPPSDDITPQDFARLPIPGIDGAFIQYPKTLTETGVLMYEAMISVLRTYAQAREPRKGSEGKKL